MDEICRIMFRGNPNQITQINFASYLSRRHEYTLRQVIKGVELHHLSYTVNLFIHLFIMSPDSASLKINTECSSNQMDFLCICVSVCAFESSVCVSRCKLLRCMKTQRSIKHNAFTCTLSTTIANITQARAFFFSETAVHTLHTAPY